MAATKYVPRPWGVDRDFFRKAIETGKVHVQRCDSCGHCQHPPRAYCASCGSGTLSFVPTDNTGVVYSFTTSHFTVDSGWVEDVPYTTVVVELPQGPRLVGTLSGDPANLEIGQKVTIRPEAKSEDFAFLWVDA